MYLICTFHHSFELEILLRDLEKIGVGRDQILAIPLHQDMMQMRKITATSTGGANILDIPLAIGTACMLLGVIYGYVLVWGPILWGLIGLVGGTLLTLLVHYLISKSKQAKEPGLDKSEVIVMVNFPTYRLDRMREVIREYRPLGFAMLDLNAPSN
ncbi:hypothetical protein [Paenibacillus hamazuiensis]|uniref:hypothetical protein n=1 Tax=Paenibacillus hamazuiensis TaxID=2936508 RepID=UPI00200D8B61|nr:hypothetical protein [Paenibacillus hamazuiensis]